ncbi:MAG: cytochrome c3 family protein [Deltaproteobacteria bacterium]|nr:cytochrome c3 family protein [Deltaproteobacteria bacterium]
MSQPHVHERDDTKFEAHILGTGILKAVNCATVPLVAMAMILFAGLPANAQSDGFDHFRTRFPLVGAHARVDCETCHRDGLFRGTPAECHFCHDGTGRRATTAPSNRHIPHAELDCGNCHRTNRWEPARMDHSIVSNRCAECHNDVFAEGKSGRHVQSTNDCGECHRTSTWRGARFDHSSITGSCMGCHNGVTAPGKHTNHLVTASDCDLCHSPRRWLPSRFDHSTVSGTCQSCHDGNTATGKNSGHLPTTSDCDQCHSNRRWIPAGFDHSGASGGCSGCHNGRDATGTPGSHFASSLECDSCHTTTGWTRVNFDHAGAAYPGDHRANLGCKKCHGGNSATVTWSAPSYQPDCAGCHAPDYKTGPHKKHENPDAKYSVSELRDCSGSCHIYTDSSLTKIKDRRDRKHRPSG